MFVRLVTPPAVTRDCWTPPLGIALLAGSLKEIGVKVHGLDLNPDAKYGEAFTTEVLGEMDEHEGAARLEAEHGAMLDDWARRCLEDDPALVGLSVLYRGMVVPALALARAIKRRRPATAVIMGGSFAQRSNQALIAHLMRDPAVDAVVVGDGEYLIRDVVSALADRRSLSDVPSTYVRDSAPATGTGAASLRLTPPGQAIDPNDLALPDFGDFELPRYRNGWFGSHPMHGSRGCVFKCRFCNSRKVSPQWRYRSTEHLMAEVRQAVEVYGARRVALTDNLVNGNAKEFARFCRALIDAQLGVAMWGSIALMPSVDAELLDLIRDAGFVDILLALETPHPTVRKDMGKWGHREGCMELIRGAVARGLRPCIYLMHSFPTETDEAFDELLHFVDGFAPSDFLAVGSWPFRLAQVQPGEYDEEFIQRFGLTIHGAGGYDTCNPRVVFGREPRWSSACVNDEIKKERHRVVTAHLDRWRNGQARRDATAAGAEWSNHDGNGGRAAPSDTLRISAI